MYTRAMSSDPVAAFLGALPPAQRDEAAALPELGGRHGVAAEARQNVARVLFTGPTPAVATYAGRGDLRGWALPLPSA